MTTLVIGAFAFLHLVSLETSMTEPTHTYLQLKAATAAKLGQRAEGGITYAVLADVDKQVRELIEGYDRLNLQQCWTWFYLAELLGTDLAKDEYRAINEDGSSYDDDVGGPAYVSGRGGVELEPIDSEQGAAARRAATALYQALEASRNA